MKKNFLRGITTLFAGVMIFVSTFSVYAANSSQNGTFNTNDVSALKFNDTDAVWMSYDNGNWDIYHKNLMTGQQSQITNNLETQGYPSVDGNYIVWQDNRAISGKNGGDFNIFLYNMVTKEERNISTVSGYHQSPIIAKGKVAWLNTCSKGNLVMLYDIATDSLSTASAENAKAFGLVFDGKVLAWMDARNSNFDIYARDLAKTEEKRITYGLEDEFDPLVSEGKILWMVNYNGVCQVYMYEFLTGYTSRVTSGQVNHRAIALSGDNMIMKEDGKLVIQNVNQVSGVPVQAPNGNMPKNIFLNGNNIIWYDGQKLISDNIADATDRGNKPITPAPQPTPTPTPSGDGQQAVQDKTVYLVKYTEDMLIKSEDGRASLTIEKGSFSTDVYIKFTSHNVGDIKGITADNKSYQWEIQGNQKPSKKMKFSINYSSFNAYNSKKISMGQVNSSNKLEQVRTIRDTKNSTLTLSVKDNGKACLLVFNKKFNDMDNHWAKENLEIIGAHQIVNGYTDGSFKPDKEMTRAEFIKTLVSSMDPKAKETVVTAKVFSDVEVDFWGAPFIQIAHKNGWIAGFEGKFNPESQITREEMITILMRIEASLSNDKSSDNKVDLSKFDDYKDISSWAEKLMQKAVDQGLVKGYDNKLNPRSNATRAEASTILLRYLESKNLI